MDHRTLRAYFTLACASGFAVGCSTGGGTLFQPDATLEDTAVAADSSSPVDTSVPTDSSAPGEDSADAADSTAVDAADSAVLDVGGSDVADAPAEASVLTTVSFGTPKSYGPATAFRVVDLDKDGALDLVWVSSSTKAVSVAYGDGSGTFGAPVTFTTGPSPQSVAVADLNGDGKLDLLVAVFGTPALVDGGTSLAGGGVSVLLAAGPRTFGPQTTYSPYPAQGPNWIATGDLDKDGRIDVVLGCHDSGGDIAYATNSVTIMFGNGSGGFDVAANKNFSIYHDGQNGVAVADFDNDGIDDLVYTVLGYYVGGTGAYVIFGDTTRSYARQASATSGYAAYGIALGDINEDKKMDVVTAEWQTKSFSVYINGTAGALTSHNYVIGSGTGHPALADFDRDGHLDVFVNGQIYPGDGTGLGFAPAIPTPFAVDARSPYGPRSAGADLDGDGRTDLIGIAGGNLMVALSTGH